MPPKKKKGLAKSKNQLARLQEEVDNQPEVVASNQPLMITINEIIELHRKV